MFEEEEKIETGADAYEYDESGAILLPLSQPFKTVGETLTVMRIEQPKGRHLRVMWRVGEKGADYAQMAYLGALCNVPPKDLDEMCAQDLQAILKAVAHLGG